MTLPIENDGPSDEEVSATSNSLIDRSPKKQPLPPPRNNKRGGTNKSRHEGKIIEIGTSRYESFPGHRRSKSSYSRDDNSESSSSRYYNEKRSSNSYNYSPTKQQIGKARQVLVHYHPQMGDEGYESTLLSSDNYGNNKLSSSRAAAAPMRQKNVMTSGMHSRSIDELREEHYFSSGGNDETDNAATRQLRRRMYRLTLERNVSMDYDKRRKMQEEDFGSSSRSRVHSNMHQENHPRANTPSSVHTSIPPPPPTTTPSYRAIVSNLIRQNEPEKLSQIDRVMVKYAGREEELITKLDLRYRKKKKRASDSVVVGGNNSDGGGGRQSEEEEVVENEDSRTVESSREEEQQVVGQYSPMKERSAIQMMQSWDRKHTETSEEEAATAAVIKSDPSEQKQEQNNPTTTTTSEPLGISARTSSTRTEIHSNTTKEIDEEDEGRLPKVPERDTVIDSSTNTPTRPVSGSTPQQQRYSPAFNDDISLITMETKGTFNRNREGVVYSYAEMMRRPPASIIVDGGSVSPKGGVASPASNANSVDYKQQQRQQFAPPKIQRLLPEYEKVSSSEKLKEAEASEEKAVAAKLDSVEARILARRKLREEQARNHLEIEGEEQKSQEKAISGTTAEENSTMAFDEEESFVGKSKISEENAIIHNSFSLIDSEEANRRSSLDGDEGGEENGLDTTLIRDNTADRVSGEMQQMSIDEPAVEDKSVIESEQPAEAKSMPDRDDIPLDELNDSIQVDTCHVASHGERPLDETNDTENSYLTCIQSPQDVKSKKDASDMSPIDDTQEAKRQHEEEVAAASRDAEIQLKAMEDEIARLIAEKESRFAAEKAVALKKAEEALEVERRARLKAEQELERLKAEAEERIKIVATLNEPEQSKPESAMAAAAAAAAAAKEPANDIVQEMIESHPEEIIHTHEAEASVPLDQDVEELSANAENAAESPIVSPNEDVSLMPVSSMDMETKQELMSMIAEMEQGSIPMTEAPPTNVNSENEVLNDSVDIVEQMRSVWALDDEDDEEDQPIKYAATSDEESDYENVQVAERSAEFVQDDDGNDSDHSNEHSYLPGSLHSSPERSATTMPVPENFPAMTMPQGLLQPPLQVDNDPTSSAAGVPLLSKNDHDIPSMYMPHRQTSAAQILDTAEPASMQAEEAEEAAGVKSDFPKKPSLFDDEEGEANIHHVAKVTFDGNPAKGQLSFTSGTEVLAHSNQRGEWWLGRCGGRTGWFPASAVVPASEYLQSLGPALGVHKSDEESIDDVDLEFPKLSQEELQETYDLIRSPSGEDESPKRPARDSSNTKPGLIGDSDTVEPQSEPFVNGQNNIRSAYDSMLDEYDSMLAPAATEQSTVKDDHLPTAQTKQSELNTTTSSGEKKPKRIWRSANDPNTGLTYYYNVKTRETTWERPDDFIEKSPSKPQPPAESTNVTEGELGIKEAVAKEPSKGSRRFLGIFSKSTTKRNDTRSRSATPTNTSLDLAQTSKQKIGNAAETEADATNQLVSNLNSTWEVDDVSSVSSEGTSNSIFSAKKVKKVLGKVGSKIAGKMNSSPTNASYGALNDSYSQKKGAQDVNHSVDKSLDAGDDVKEPPTSSALNANATQVELSPEKKAVPTDNNDANPTSDKKKSRWRSAIDPQTGRTYYFHKDTQETVWEKPSNF